MASDLKQLHAFLTNVGKFLEQQSELYGDLFLTRGAASTGASAGSPMTKRQQPVDAAADLFGQTPIPQERRKDPQSAYPEEPWTGAGDLDALNSMICNCLKCPLGHTRTRFVFGVGNPKADLVLVGEAPGADEDLQGEPFVGRAGQLLNKILEAINFRREEVYICNILKCRPPNNREPQPEEIASCEPYLWKQLELLQPKLILCLGRVAAQALLKTNDSLTSLRGKVHDYRGTRLMVTYHPAALLRNPNWKRPTWEDVQKVRKLIDELTHKQ
jgi:DNA polymerase